MRELDDLRERSEQELVAWWTRQFGFVAGMPSGEARITWLLSMLRDLARLEPEHRKRVTRARTFAAIALPDELLPTIPGAADVPRRMAWS